jgi:TRAP-type transport system small permease protein
MALASDATATRSVLARAYDGLLWALAATAAGLIGAMLLGITLDVALRNLLVTGINGIVEYTEFGLYLSTVLAAPWLLRQGQHIRADLLGPWLKGAPLRLLDAAADLLGVGVSLVVAWYALATARESFALGSLVRRTVEFPEWWLIAPLPPVMLLLALEFLRRLALTLTAPGARPSDARAVS